MDETRNRDDVMNEAELVDSVNRVIELAGEYSDLCTESRKALYTDFDMYDMLSKKASGVYRDFLTMLYNIASTYTIDGRTEYFTVREMRRREGKNE